MIATKTMQILLACFYKIIFPNANKSSHTTLANLNQSSLFSFTFMCVCGHIMSAGVGSSSCRGKQMAFDSLELEV